MSASLMMMQGDYDAWPTEGTVLNKPNPLEETKMKVTYRGVSYDTAEYRNRPTQTKEVKETYRGISYTSKVEVVK